MLARVAAMFKSKEREEPIFVMVIHVTDAYVAQRYIVFFDEEDQKVSSIAPQSPPKLSLV